MLSFFKTTGKPGAGKETSFHAEIAERERELGDRSTDMTRAETIVEELDELMPRIQDKRDKGYCLSVLVQACRERGILPESCKISGIELKQEQIVGVVADITMGKRGQEDICVKIFRQYQDADREKIKKALYHRAVRWKHISHPNVLPFLGVYGPDIIPPGFGLITPRMLGNIKDYTREYKDVDRLPLLKTAARGLEYLHSLEIVHGRLNPRNILIIGAVTACIGDFEIAEITNTLGTAQSTTATRQQDVIRYMSPEQLANNPAEEGSDVYSFAITAYEVLVGTDAYAETNAKGKLGPQIIGGIRPVRPKDPAIAKRLNDDIWKILESCWSHDLSARPTIGKCAKCFKPPFWLGLRNQIPGRSPSRKNVPER